LPFIDLNLNFVDEVRSEEGALRLALVLWGGYIGGAESFTADLAREMRRQGAEAGVVFVLDGEPLARRLDGEGVPHASLSLPRGRSVLLRPRRFARAVSSVGPDVSILIECGFLPAALRIGGYRSPIIAVEHGAVLELDRLPLLRRSVRLLSRASGAWACSAVVAVSDYVLDRISRGMGARRLVCIPNGVDLERFSPSPEKVMRENNGNEIWVACAARLIEGKGIDDLIRAFAVSGSQHHRLRIAGDGPERKALESLANSVGADGRIEFLGIVLDMPEFWRNSDIAVVPSNEFVESFGMAAVEAMACAKPVIASNNGALPRIVVDGHTGRIFEAGDTAALACALEEYSNDSALRTMHGSNARRRCEDEFSLDRTASRYLALCEDVARRMR
jgi:glycosyltransferase involved in cell wall biosynthesis